MKENRKIEELILMFATNATNVLKKEPSLAGDGWKVELNNQISHLVRLIRECLRTLNLVPPELHARLDMYAAKLTPSPTFSDSGYDSTSTSRDHRDSVSSPTWPSGNVTDMALVKTSARLFKLTEFAMQKELDQIKCACTEKVRVDPQSDFMALSF